MNAVVERVKMALAEAGYPNAWVIPDGPSVVIDRNVSAEASWRAASLAGVVARNGRGLTCFACFNFANNHNQIPAESRTWDCLARGEGIEDCGADRNCDRALDKRRTA